MAIPSDNLKTNYLQMKRLLYFTIILGFILAITSCNDDFLDKNQRAMYSATDTLFLNNSMETANITYTLPSSESCNYSIYMFPTWLSFNSMNGEMTNGTIQLSFAINKDNLPFSTSEYRTCQGTLILDVEKIGFVSLVVSYANYGKPNLFCSPGTLNFESLNSKMLTITNTGDGLLNWKINNVPDWLILSKTSGSLYAAQSETISVSWNYSLPVPTENLSATLLFSSNSISGDFVTSVYLNASSLIPPMLSQSAGTVTDAEYFKESGLMAICTKWPNALILYNTKTNTSQTLSLSKTPQCISISEDGHRAAIGYSVASASLIDLNKNEIIKDYDLDCLPYDIVLGDAPWCYITPSIDQWVYFRTLNLTSGEITVGKNWSMIYEKTMIKKIPGKPSLVGSRMNLSPTGILLIDVTKGIASDTITYWHESIGKFWISSDGSKLFTGYKNVYRMPQYDGEFHPDQPAIYGRIETSEQAITAFDECPARNRCFAASSGYWEEAPSKIEQFDLTNLNKINEFDISPIYIKENGSGTLYDTSVKYLFVNKEGTELYAIKNLKASYNKNYWAIEKFRLN